MKKYTLRTERFGISRERQRELIYLCRQYDEMRRRLEYIRAGAEEGRPKGGGAPVWARDPTGSRAARAVDSWYAHRVDAIERSARAADPELWRYLLLHVARGTPYEKLKVPCGRRQFLAARAAFFIELDQRLRGD